MAEMVNLTMVLHTLCNCMREIDGVSQGIPPNIRVALPGGGQRIFAHQSSDPPYHHYREVLEESQAFKPPVRIHTLDPVDEKLREERFESTKAMRERLKVAEPQLTPQQRSDVQAAIDAHMAGLTQLKPDPAPGGAFTMAMAQQAINAIAQSKPNPVSYAHHYMAQPRYAPDPDPKRDPMQILEHVIDQLAEANKDRLMAAATEAERVTIMRELIRDWVVKQEAAGKQANTAAQQGKSLLRAPVMVKPDPDPPFNGLPMIPKAIDEPVIDWKALEPKPVEPARPTGVKVKDPKGLWKPFTFTDKRRVKG